MEPLDPETATAHNAPQPLLPKWPKRFWGLVGVVVLVLTLANLGLSAPVGAPAKGTIFTIENGESLGAVASALVKQKYIRSTFAFDSLVVLFGGERRIESGDYSFSHDAGAVRIAWQLSHGEHDIPEIKITIPEGKTVSDISAVLGEKIPGFDVKSFVAEATPYEGYLFPETYFFPPTVTPADVITEMRAMYTTKTAGLFESSAAGHTEAEIVTMASLVESEASGPGDRATIAGILWNRLALGMRLQVDATVGTAFDTYREGGLPPKPINNPGLLAIQAALNPTETPYLYYLHDKNGTIHYAKTFAEHKQNIATYLK